MSAFRIPPRFEPAPHHAPRDFSGGHPNHCAICPMHAMFHTPICATAHVLLFILRKPPYINRNWPQHNWTETLIGVHFPFFHSSQQLSSWSHPGHPGSTHNIYMRCVSCITIPHIVISEIRTVLTHSFPQPLQGKLNEVVTKSIYDISILSTLCRDTNIESLQLDAF